MRYGICAVVGSGTDDDPWKPDIHQKSGVRAVIESDQDGRPLHNWCLVRLKYSHINYTGASLEKFPDTDDLAMDAADYNRIRAKLIEFGMSTIDAMFPSDTIAEIREKIGKYLKKDFTTLEDRKFGASRR